MWTLNESNKKNYEYLCYDLPEKRMFSHFFFQTKYSVSVGTEVFCRWHWLHSISIFLRHWLFVVALFFHSTMKLWITEFSFEFLIEHLLWTSYRRRISSQSDARVFSINRMPILSLQPILNRLLTENAGWINRFGEMSMKKSTGRRCFWTSQRGRSIDWFLQYLAFGIEFPMTIWAFFNKQLNVVQLTAVIRQLSKYPFGFASMKLTTIFFSMPRKQLPHHCNEWAERAFVYVHNVKPMSHIWIAFCFDARRQHTHDTMRTKISCIVFRIAKLVYVDDVVALKVIAFCHREFEYKRNKSKWKRRKYSDLFPCHSMSNVRDERRLGLFSVVRSSVAIASIQRSIQAKNAFFCFDCVCRMVFCSAVFVLYLCFLILILCFAWRLSTQSVFRVVSYVFRFNSISLCNFTANAFGAVRKSLLNPCVRMHFVVLTGFSIPSKTMELTQWGEM